MKGVYGLYETPQAAQRAFDGLRAAGIPAGDITVLSSEPLEEWEFASKDHKTVMPWIAVLGAGLGLTIFLQILRPNPVPFGFPCVANGSNKEDAIAGGTPSPVSSTSTCK